MPTRPRLFVFALYARSISCVVCAFTFDTHLINTAGKDRDLLQYTHIQNTTRRTEVDPVDRPAQQALGARDVDAEAVVGAVGHDGVHGLAPRLAHLFGFFVGVVVVWGFGIGWVKDCTTRTCEQTVQLIPHTISAFTYLGHLRRQIRLEGREPLLAPEHLVDQGIALDSGGDSLRVRVRVISVIFLDRHVG